MKLFFVSYEPRKMIVRTAPMSPAADLAHRRLADWIWSEGRAPRNSARGLSAIVRCSPEEWRTTSRELKRNGWVATKSAFSHPEVIETLREARRAYATAIRAGRASGAVRARKAQVRADAGAQPPTANSEHPTTNIEQPTTNIQQQTSNTFHVSRFTEHPTSNTERLTSKIENPTSTGKSVERPSNDPPTPFERPSNDLPTNHDERSTIQESRSKTKDSLSDKTAERSALSSSPPEQGSSDENRFLRDLVSTLETFNPRQSSTELTNWGGWWRLRFREDPDKARRVLAEIRSMIREHRVRRNAGAAAKDLWERFA